MPRKKIEKMDITCLSCKQVIKDASMLENSASKCPHCGFEFVMDKETLALFMRETLIRVNELRKRIF